MEHDSQTYRFEKDGYRYEVHHPQPEHDHDAEPHETLLISLNGDEYTLACSPYSADAGLQCRFSVGMSEWGYIISSRSRAQYQALMPGFVVDPTKQCIEVGAGLSEAIVTWADMAAMQSNPGPKPIVIDPANFSLMTHMLEAAIELAPQEEHMHAVEDALRQLHYRCSTILDPDRVELLPMELQMAHGTRMDLRGVADTVVDCFAAATYVTISFVKPNVERQRQRAREKVLALERSFLKQDGGHFIAIPAHHS
jgi:hypothetical protein